jgi:hypothetical protein
MESYPDVNHDMENELGWSTDIGVADLALQVVETVVETRTRTLSFPNAAMALFSALWLRETYGESAPCIETRTDESTETVN